MNKTSVYKFRKDFTMNILVFDDKEINREAARAQLNNHNVTVVGTYDEAKKLLLPEINVDKLYNILEERFGSFNPYESEDESKKDEYNNAREIIREQVTIYPNFDVVLTDLLVPASGCGSYNGRLVGEEMSMGIFIGFLAAVKARAKYVAVFTDSNHHEHPASACFDAFNAGETVPTPFKVEDSKVLLSNTRSWVNKFDPDDLRNALSYEEWSDRTDTVEVKNWRSLLNYLLGKKEKEVEDDCEVEYVD